MTDHHIIASEDNNPSIRLFASPDAPQVFLLVDSGLSTSFHLTRSQAAKLVAALTEVEAELAARDVAIAAMAGQLVTP